MTDKRLLTPEQVAERLQVTRRTVYQWINDGKLPALKVGRGWRIDESSLDSYLKPKQLEQLIEQTAKEMEDLAESIKQRQTESPSDFAEQLRYQYQQGQIDALQEWAAILRDHLRKGRDDQ